MINLGDYIFCGVPNSEFIKMVLASYEDPPMFGQLITTKQN